MTIPHRLAGPAIVAAAFAVNAFCNHTEPGNALRQLPGVYPVVFFVGIGAVLPALALGRAVRREPAAARPLGVAPGRRDALAVLAALALGGLLAAKPLAPILALPGGTAHVATLFVQLLVASIAEVALFLGAVGLAVHAWLGGHSGAPRGGGSGGRSGWRSGLLTVAASSLLFGLFHLTYPAPWNTPGTAATVGLVWIAAATLFAVTRSLMAAVLLDNILATVGFATRDLALPLSPEASGLFAAMAIAAFAAAFAWARQGNGPQRSDREEPPTPRRKKAAPLAP